MPFFLLTLTVPLDVLSMDQAVQTALARHPTAVVARAQADAARAHARQARAALLPSLDLSGRYGWSVSDPTGAPSQSGDAYSADLSAGVLLWDFGQSNDRWRASQASAEAVGATTHATDEDLVLGVRQSYLDAREAHALIQVAQDTLANDQRHLEQTEAFVKVGTHPDIDLARLRTQVATDQAALVRTQNDYLLAKVRLNQAMGASGRVDYDVADVPLPAVAGETGATEGLYAEAVKTRPELAGLRSSIRAQELTLSAQKKWIAPSLRLGADASWMGDDFSSPTWGASVGVSLSWTLFDGLAGPSGVEAERAGLVVSQAQLSGRELDVWGQVEQARIGVVSAVAQLQAAESAVTSARELLRLAEARYDKGVGASLELSDAQLEVANAEAERVRDEHDVAVARAQLLRALGRRDWR